MPPGEEAEVDVRRYLRALWRRKLLILLVVLLAVNITLVLSLRQDPVYQGDARVLLSPQMFGDRTGLALDAALAVQTEIQILESEPIRAMVAEELGQVSDVSAERVGQTLLISVKARAGNAQRAADVSDAYARAYVRYRGGGASSASSQSDVAASTVTPEVVSQSKVPRSPLAPKPVRDSILAGVLGLLVAVGLATGMEALDDTVKTRAELRKATDLPVLGVIPTTPSWDADTVSFQAVQPAAAEAFRALRTSVQLLGVDRPIRTLQVSSAGSGEGKTTIVANLAVVLAQMGQRVVMVDADLRRPRLHEIFGLSNTTGVTSVLAGDVPVLEAVQPAGPQDNLTLLASGPPPPNPSELLGSKKMAQLIFTLGDHFDLVIIDSPPVLAVTDAIVITTWADATVLVCRAGRTKRKLLQTTLEVLRQAEAPLAGTVLIRASADEDGRSKYYAYYQQAGQAAADRSKTASAADGNGVAARPIVEDQGDGERSRVVPGEADLR